MGVDGRCGQCPDTGFQKKEAMIIRLNDCKVIASLIHASTVLLSRFSHLSFSPLAADLHC